MDERDTMPPGDVSPETISYPRPENAPELIREVQDRVLQSHRPLLERARGDERAREQFYRLVGTLIAESGAAGEKELERREIRATAQSLLGFGPITDLLADESVTEIMVNGPHRIWVERSGRLEETNLQFGGPDKLMNLLERVFGDLGRRIDLAHPWADGRLPDGSRVHAVLPPLAVDGPYLTIRKFSREMFELDELIRRDTLNRRVAQSLISAVERRENILISGAAGTGKTTLMNALSRGISSGERVVTIEDSTELQLQHAHWLRMETRLPNPDGGGEVTMRDLVRNALRMRPDRIIIGEVRGKEAFELLVALTTGHAGAMATIHSSGTGQALTRMMHLIQMADSGIPFEAVAEQVHEVIDLVVHLVRDAEGNRRVGEIRRIDSEPPGRRLG